VAVNRSGGQRKIQGNKVTQQHEVLRPAGNERKLEAAPLTGFLVWVKDPVTLKKGKLSELFDPCAKRNGEKWDQTIRDDSAAKHALLLGDREPRRELAAQGTINGHFPNVKRERKSQRSSNSGAIGDRMKSGKEKEN